MTVNKILQSLPRNYLKDLMEKEKILQLEDFKKVAFSPNATKNTN